ncbi:MAG: hypothetical protein ACFFHV_16930 [Promethearchaeota archaeon]
MVLLQSFDILNSILQILCSRTSMKSENTKVRLKGKFLFVAFFLFLAGAISDTIFLRDILTLLITRIILISASIFFYFGFILPNFVKKRFES